MVEQSVAAKMPARNKRNKDDISEKDEFHLPQIVSCKGEGFASGYCG